MNFSADVVSYWDNGQLFYKIDLFGSILWDYKYLKEIVVIAIQWKKLSRNSQMYVNHSSKLLCTVFMSTHVFYWPTFSCNGNHFCFIKLKNFNVFVAGNQKFLRKTFWSNFWSTKSFHDFPKRLFQEPTTKMLEDTLNVFQTIDI